MCSEQLFKRFLAKNVTFRFCTFSILLVLKKRCFNFIALPLNRLNKEIVKPYVNIKPEMVSLHVKNKCEL